MDLAKKEFVMLWVLLTATAATNDSYSTAQSGNTIASIFQAITNDVAAVKGSGWNWPNLTPTHALNVVTKLYTTEQKVQAYFSVEQDFLGLIAAGDAEWSGGGAHPAVGELVTALNI